MNTLNHYITEYIEYCEYRKRLDKKTLKAYRIDLAQYEKYASKTTDAFSKNVLDSFITELHKQYKPKTVKRKILISRVIMFSFTARVQRKESFRSATLMCFPLSAYIRRHSKMISFHVGISL